MKLYNEGASLGSIRAKIRVKEYLENKSIEFTKKQKDYYKEIVLLFIQEALKRYRVSDADIVRNEYEYKHSTILTDNDKDIFNLNNFLSNFLEEWHEFNGYIDRTLQFIFFDYYNPDNFRMLNISQFEKLFAFCQSKEGSFPTLVEKHPKLSVKISINHFSFLLTIKT